jgi:LmbE family N-acetylglucosaminyl deacetylase
MQVLIVAPHPDDDVIGCGGSIIRHIRKGHTVTVVYMTSGEAGSLVRAKEELRRIREAETSEAASVMGFSDLIFLRNADGCLSADAENLTRLTRIIREKRPEMIYFPHAGEGCRDHRITHEICVEVVKRARGPWFQECPGEPWSVESVLCYEIWTPLAEVSYTEEISDCVDLKLEALRRHRSQLASIPYDEAVRGLNRYRGAMTRRGIYCECFQILFTCKSFINGRCPAPAVTYAASAPGSPIPQP